MNPQWNKIFSFIKDICHDKSNKGIRSQKLNVDSFNIPKSFGPEVTELFPMSVTTIVMLPVMTEVDICGIQSSGNLSCHHATYYPM